MRMHSLFSLSWPSLGLLLLAASTAFAQAPDTPAVGAVTPQSAPAPAVDRQRLRVYLDCNCFQTYLREHIAFVDFVRQAQDADVHLLSAESDTGGGGSEIVLRFVGRGRFAGHDQDLKVINGVGDTEDTRRVAVLRTIVVGILDYMARSGLPAGMEVTISSNETGKPGAVKDHDPWNLWAYSIRANGQLEADESNRSREWQLRFSADRVTDNWKISVAAHLNHQVETFELDDDEPFKVTRRDSEMRGFAIKSVGPHWSVGGEGIVSASTFGNTQRSSHGAVAVEYSVFPYAEYASRQWRIDYLVGPERNSYNETTIFGKIRETLWRQRLLSELEQRQPWGTLEASFEFGQYLHDRSKYRLEGEGSVSVRVTRGLSLNLRGSATRIRDQLSLPLRDATDQEVLLRIRQLQSGYELDVEFGVTYSFGSIFNNIVNPRFGT
jgi:hypothetical protein